MHLLQLKYFQVVAKNEHMTNSAEELHITQPSLSKSISKLEEELGVQLFERAGREIKLNNFGKAFLKRVDRIFLEIENGKRELVDMLINESSIISIAANNLCSFSKLLEGYLKLYPNTIFKQVMGSTIKMQQQLEKGEVDFCISSPPIEGYLIECVPLTIEEIFLIVPLEHRFASREEIDLIEVENDSFVSLKKGFGIRDLTEKFCQKAGFNQHIAFETDISANLMGLVNANMGVSLLPIIQWDDTKENRSVPIQIKKPKCSRKIALSFRKEQYLSDAAIQFKDYLIDYFKEI